jgi:5'-3' exonuclease
LKSYNFYQSNCISKIGVEKAINYLKSFENTISIENVELDKIYQELDIDLIWSLSKNGKEKSITIEVKTDTYMTGNIFLETISNDKKKTLGCFMKSKADYWFYYFSGYKIALLIPLFNARCWFTDNLIRFKEKKTSTFSNNKILYTSTGYIVPIKILAGEVDGVKIFDLRDN